MMQHGGVIIMAKASPQPACRTAAASPCYYNRPTAAASCLHPPARTQLDLWRPVMQRDPHPLLLRSWAPLLGAAAQWAVGGER